MKRAVEAIVGTMVTAGLWVWTGSKAMLDWFGYTVIATDLTIPDSTASKILRWVFSTPWYVPAVLATLATVAAIYAFLRGSVPDRSRVQTAAQPAAPTANGAGITPATKAARAAMLAVFNKSADFASDEILHVAGHLYEFMRRSGGGIVFQTGILINDHVAGAHDNHRAALRNILTEKEATHSLAQLEAAFYEYCITYVKLLTALRDAAANVEYDFNLDGNYGRWQEYNRLFSNDLRDLQAQAWADAFRQKLKGYLGPESIFNSSLSVESVPRQVDKEKEAAAQPITLPANNTLLKDATIEWDGGARIIFKGTALRSGEKLRIDLEVWAFGGYHPASRPYVLSSGRFGEPRGMEIGFVESFARGQQVTSTLAIMTEHQGNQYLFQWGDEKYGHYKAGVTSGSYFGRIVISKEESYPFMVVGIGQPGKANVPVILSPSLITEISTH